MLSDAKVKSLKIEDGKRHADRDGLVLEIRPSTPFSTLNCRTQAFQVFLDFAKNSKYTRKGYVHGRLYHHRILFDR